MRVFRRTWHQQAKPEPAQAKTALGSVLQIGNTPLYKSPLYEGRCTAAPSVRIKDESVNAGGTFKVRARETLLVDLEFRYSSSSRETGCLEQVEQESVKVGIVQVTSGNSGVILGELAKRHSLAKVKFEVVNIVSKDLPRSIKKALGKCSHIVEVDLASGMLGPAELLEIAHKKTGIPLTRIHHVETTIHPDGYPKIISEIAAAGVKPRYVFCPG